MSTFLNKTHLHFFFILLLISVSTCKEKEKKPEDLGFLSLGEAKDYLWFKPGTSWVYKNSLTNEIDSMTLLSCNIDTFHASSDKRFFDYEDLGFYIKSSRDQAAYLTYSPGMTADAINHYEGWLWECIRKDGYYSNYFSNSGLSCQFYYPFDKYRGRGNGVYETKFIERKDSMNVKGETYYNIVSFYVYHDDSYPYPNIYVGQFGYNIYYWAKNFGLVKIEMQGYDANGNKVFTNWELIQSHIYK